MDGTETTPAPAGKARVALILSLAVNLLLVGLIGGAMLGGRGPMGPGRAAVDVGFGPLSAALTPDDRRALRDRFIEKLPEFRAEREASRAEFEAFAAVMRAEPWDRAAAEAILQRQGERGLARLDAGRTLMLDYIAGLTSEARRAFADRIEDALRHPRPRGD